MHLVLSTVSYVRSIEYEISTVKTIGEMENLGVVHIQNFSEISAFMND